MENVRRRPSLIEFQTFISDAIRIVNDRLLTSVSSLPNDLSPITPASFLGQQLAPNTPVGTFHVHGDLRRAYLYNAYLAHKFWLHWIKGYLPTLQGRNKWRITRENLVPGQLVLVGYAEDICKRWYISFGTHSCCAPPNKKGSGDCSSGHRCCFEIFLVQ